MTKLFRIIRHLPLLRRMDLLWDTIRPSYLAWLARNNPRGMTARLNDLVDIRVCPLISEHIHGGRILMETGPFSVFYENIRPWDTFFDVGANVGWYAIAAGVKLRGSGRAVAFEPNPWALCVLLEQLRLNELEETVAVCDALIGDGTGKARITNFAACSSGDSPLSSAAYRPIGALAIERPMLSLDEYSRQTDLWPTVLKIDVEGYELRVLHGCHEILSRRPTVFLEVHPQFMSSCGDSPEALMRFMDCMGYECRGLNGERKHEITYEHVIFRKLV